MTRVIVLGAGIIGAAIAHGLTRAGADVTVVDRAGPAAGATGRSFGWINASFHLDVHHYRLRVAGMDAWHRLAERVSLPVNWQGALWWEEQGAGLTRMQEALEGAGYPVARLTRDQVAVMEPDLTALPDEALHFPTEGAVDPAGVTRRLLAASGARCLWGVEALGIEERGGRVTGLHTAQGVIAADRVVLAGGVGTPALLDPLGVSLPMLSRPGVLMHTTPVAARLRHILVTPEQEVRQLPDGRLMAPTAASHQSDTTEEITDSPEMLASAAAGRLGALIGQPDLGWSEVALAHRPVPGDGRPVIGAAGPEGLYLAVLHSGITLAAITAELAVAEMLNGTDQALLAPYRVQRFAK